jgi:peroxiredoxin
MIMTSAKGRELSMRAPKFSLPDTSGRIVSIDDFSASPALLVVFWCNHCPFVIHIKHGFAQFAREYQSKGLGIVAINANDAASHPADRPERMRDDIETFGYTFAYLIDASQDVARAYDAACTPEFFLFDRERKLAYHGQFDASRPRNREPVTGADLRRAADAVLAGRTVSGEQTMSIGCNIKWRA